VRTDAVPTRLIDEVIAASIRGVPADLPLSTLLSHALVAFTVELDNEFERQLAGSGHHTFLVSLVMWSNFMRFVGEDGAPVRELAAAAGIPKAIHPSLAGMERWGYVTVLPDPADGRPKPPRGDWIVRPTAAGRSAQELWRPLTGAIEHRWQERFGMNEISELREALAVIVGQLDGELPQYLPVVDKAMFASGHHELPVPSPHDGDIASRPPLSALLSQVLLTFALDYERESNVSLAMNANVVRVVDEDGVRVRDVPHVAGVSKEAISMAVGFLERNGYAVVEPDPTAGRTKLVRLTSRGREAQNAHGHLLGVVEERWEARFGGGNVGSLRASLEGLVVTPELERSPLVRGLVPHPGGWRTRLPKPKTLPHHPMVLHRGGWPDGS
jgi:DNA-binding MarR family transcriptional regulator